MQQPIYTPNSKLRRYERCPAGEIIRQDRWWSYLGGAEAAEAEHLHHILLRVLTLLIIVSFTLLVPVLPALATRSARALLLGLVLVRVVA
jgi:hypothetical protein